MQQEIITRLAAALGKTAEETEKLLSSNPQLASLFSSLSPRDAQKLISVLSDKTALSRVLASPQAKQIMDSLGGGKNGRT